MTAGTRMPTITGTMTTQSPETMMPAMARPRPLSRPWLRSMLMRLKTPRITPTTALTPSVQKPRMPSTRLAMALRHVFGFSSSASGEFDGSGESGD